MNKLVLHVHSGDQGVVSGALSMMNHFRRQADGQPFSAVLVATGGAVTWFRSDSPLADAAKELLRCRGVAIELCRNALGHNNIPESTVLPGTVVVPAGVFEMVRLQELGYAYVRA
ncbi:MAG: DsrE family protein [Victivallaceae bacterium]|nr:DsrE family protein [Victivallaceae bacterium]